MGSNGEMEEVKGAAPRVSGVEGKKKEGERCPCGR